MHARHVVLFAAAAFLLIALPALADQKIKTKSNIKNDRVASTCGQTCDAAGHAWAAENKVVDAATCDSSSPAFTEGCKAYLKEQAAATPPSN
jgi:hypothetical protein